MIIMIMIIAINNKNEKSKIIQMLENTCSWSTNDVTKRLKENLQSKTQ